MRLSRWPDSFCVQPRRWLEATGKTVIQSTEDEHDKTKKYGMKGFVGRPVLSVPGHETAGRMSIANPGKTAHPMRR